MSAVISKCGDYRYALWRDLQPTLGSEGGTVLFVMLNPSRADDRRDDPTIRRCKDFAARDGFSRLAVANLYGLRSTHPQDLYVAKDPVGPDNDSHVAGLARDVEKVVVAWGHQTVPGIKARIATVTGLLRQVHPELFCLGTTDSGQPRHPLFVPRDTALQLWETR